MDRVEKAGGKVIFPKRQISPERGFMGVFNDTEGNRIALHSKA
jgi:predicted enzyme related to lactoylglutathione lyase